MTGAGFDVVNAVSINALGKVYEPTENSAM